MILPRIVAGDFELEDFSNLPRILLANLSTRLDEYYSCTNRLENSLYRFSIYANTLPEVEALISKIEEVYDSCDLAITGRTFNGMIWAGSGITELVPGIWLGIVDYEIFTVKEPVVV